ncbi:MAG TPA: hypothetical protein VF784_06160 [Anaerolineales bacterium]
MESRHPTPTHASYRAHRRQVTWQILAPVIVASLLLLAAAVLVSLAAAHGGGDIGRWAAISTIWLLIPVLFVGLVLLLILVAIAYVMGLATEFIPPYTRKAQVFVSHVEAGVRRAASVAYRPRLILPVLRQWIQRAFRKIQGR